MPKSGRPCCLELSHAFANGFGMFALSLPTGRLKATIQNPRNCKKMFVFIKY